MNILERLKSATGPMKIAERNDIAFEAGFHGENYALMVAALGDGLDAVGSALALVERMLPDAEFELSNSEDGLWYFRFVGGVDYEQIRMMRKAATPALAILTALFSALATKERE